jgi:hypothetical protein
LLFSPGKVQTAVPLFLCLQNGQAVIEEKTTGEISTVSCESWKRPYEMNIN